MPWHEKRAQTPSSKTKIIHRQNQTFNLQRPITTFILSFLLSALLFLYYFKNNFHLLSSVTIFKIPQMSLYHHFLHKYCIFCCAVYHTSHLFFGFILDPTGQENSWENSGRLDRGPITRNWGGEWGSFSICKFVASSVLEEHHTYKKIYDSSRYSFNSLVHYKSVTITAIVYIVPLLK